VHVGPVSGHEWELAVLAVPVHLAALKGGRRLAARRALELRVPCRPAFTVFRPRLAATLSSLSPRALLDRERVWCFVSPKAKASQTLVPQKGNQKGTPQPDERGSAGSLPRHVERG
jgi:hypothetical protein